MSELPTLQEEIDRKAVETLDWLVRSVMQKKLSVEQFSTGVDALFMAVSGLVKNKGFIDAITETQILLDQRKVP